MTESAETSLFIEEVDRQTLIIYGLDNSLKTIKELEKVEGVTGVDSGDDGGLTIFLSSPEVFYEVQLVAHALCQGG